MRKRFFEKYARDIHVNIAGMGATFTDLVDKPEQVFAEAAYVSDGLASVPLRAATGKDLGVPVFMVKYLMGTLRNGYVIAAFRRRAAVPAG
jgi:hypothetical protein